MKLDGNAKIAAVIVVLLLFSSVLAVFSFSAPAAVAATDYGDIMQYGWHQTGYDSGNTRFNPGPAPSRADIKWAITAAARLPGEPTFTGITYAWDGKIFSFSGSWIRCFDAFTGRRLWNVTMASGWTHQSGTGGTPHAFRIDDVYAGIWTSRGPVFFDYIRGEITAYTFFNTTQPERAAQGLPVTITLGGGSVFYYAGFYSSEAKIFVRYARFGDNEQHGAVAFDCSDPTKPAPVKWIFRADTGVEVLAHGGGMTFLGGYGEGIIYAVNSTTGELVWRNWKNGHAGYSGTYYEGVFYHGGGSEWLTAYDGRTGEVLWNKHAGPRAYYVYGLAAGYGRIYVTNIAVDPAGYVGCYDAKTGELLWKTYALYNIAYLVPVLADGKLFVQRYQGTAAGIAAETATFACFDAFTGTVIWEYPGYSDPHPNIAYGNLYLTMGGVMYCVGDSTREWPMWHGIPGSNGVAFGVQGPSKIEKYKWAFEAEGPFVCSPVGANGKIYATNLDQHVYCVDARTGKLIWKFKAGYMLRSTPAVVGDRVFIGPDDGFIYALNASNGDLIWKTPAGIAGTAVLTPAWQARSSPIVSGARLYVGGTDGKLYCVSTSNGALLWSVTLGNVTSPICGTPLVSDNVVYIAGGLMGNTTNSPLTALHATNGTIIWQRQIDTNARRAVGTPIQVGGAILIATSWWPATGEDRPSTREHRVAMFNASTGAHIASADLRLSTGTTPAVFTPTYKANTTITVAAGSLWIQTHPNFNYSNSITRTFDVVYAQEGMFVSAWAILQNGTTLFNGTSLAATPTEHRFIVNQTMFARVWAQWLGHQSFSALVVTDNLQGEKVYSGSEVNSITVLNGTSGKSLSTFATGGPVNGMVALYEGRLYACSQDKKLYCFEETPSASMSMWANSNKGIEMFVNEQVTISGRLQPKITAQYRVDYGSYAANGIPNATIKVSFTKPDMSSVDLTTTTDYLGYFNVTFSPTELGDWGWVAWYDGEDKGHIIYEAANSEWNPFTVIKPWETTPPEPEPGEEFPLLYVYVAVAVVVIVLVAVGAYVLVKRKK